MSEEEYLFRWGDISDKEHEACISKMATNNSIRSSFSGHSHQLECFGQVLGRHALAVVCTMYNVGFKQDIDGVICNGEFLQLPEEMQDFLLGFALKSTPEV